MKDEIPDYGEHTFRPLPGYMILGFDGDEIIIPYGRQSEDSPFFIKGALLTSITENPEDLELFFAKVKDLPKKPGCPCPDAKLEITEVVILTAEKFKEMIDAIDRLCRGETTGIIGEIQ